MNSQKIFSSFESKNFLKISSNFQKLLKQSYLKFQINFPVFFISEFTMMRKKNSTHDPSNLNTNKKDFSFHIFKSKQGNLRLFTLI